jgi:ATP-independent RNA helicase DbpA
MQMEPGELLKILVKFKIHELIPMQQMAMDTIAMHENIMLLSATGSGKTLAFLLPLLQLVEAEPAATQALIIVPSRELAMQIEMVFKKMGTLLKITCCYGGHKREIEENNLTETPAVIVGTPGRLADHIRRGNIQTDSIHTLILDEFDKSLELGFQEEMEFITGSLRGLGKRILTSATAAVPIPAFIGMDPVTELNFLLPNSTETGLAVKLVKCGSKDKLEPLFKLICMLGNKSMIIFCNHRESVERTSNWLKEKDIVNVFYHGAMEQRDRDLALCKFRNGTVNVLVTTDLASRGLDITNIRYIIHYQLPLTEDVFTHRNGRTARMDATGTAILLIGPEEKIPAYIKEDPEFLELPEKSDLPEKPQWSTLFIAAGKKDKINKVDIVGFLTNRGQLKKEDIGLIEVKDFFSFAGIRKNKAGHALQLIRDQKIKNKKINFSIAK